MGLLNGIRVLEIGTALAGPYSATLLSDLGADVVKLEKPKRGDLIRFTDDYVRGESGYFLGINRGKQGLTADVRTLEGQGIVKKMAAEFDVIIENFRGGRMAEWGLGYDVLSEINPRLVYCSLSAFGSAREYERESGNDVVLASYSGILDLTGDPDGAPAKPGAPFIDVVGSCLATIGILAALMERTQSGRGRHVKTSLLDASFAAMPNFMVSVLNGNPDFRRLGSGHPQLVPYQAFECADGRYVVVGAFHRKSWRQLCAALDREDLTTDPRFLENWHRVENRDTLIPIVQTEIKKRDAWEWVEIFRRVDIPVAPVLTLKESVSYFAERLPGLVIDVQHDTLGPVAMLRPPWQFDPPIANPTRAAPVLGADSDALLSQFGYDRAAIDDLRDRGLI
jgi:crotonobetainyl-CoA:carnitine CoA-transferase CaiB-like acyl-CoA transferase